MILNLEWYSQAHSLTCMHFNLLFHIHFENINLMNINCLRWGLITRSQEYHSTCQELDVKTFRKGIVKNDGCNSFCSCSDLNVLHTEGYHRLELKLHQISALCSDGGGDDVVDAVVSGIAFYPAWRGRPAVDLQYQQDTISVGSTLYINRTQSLVKEITEENKVPQPPSARHQT